MKNPLEYQLEKYSGKKSRFTCPKCNKAGEFTRYINSTTGDRLPSHVGICNRKSNCGYSYSSWDYMKENPDNSERNYIKPVTLKLKIKPTYIDVDLRIKSMSHYSENNLYKFICNQIGKEKTEKTFEKYYVGTSKHWAGSTTFWQVDRYNNIRSGKIMLYNPEIGKRIHNKQTWVHSVLGTKEFHLSQCLFGEHLLALEENLDKTLAIAESEKTALVASNFIDKVLWLATGGLDLLNPGTDPNKFKCIIGKEVILYPDLSLPNKFNGETAFCNWTRKAETLRSMGINVTVSEILENNSTEEDRKEGLDIADYLIKENQNLQ